MTSRDKGSPKVALFDFLVALLVFFLIIALLESPSKPTVRTYGVMAITTQWQSEDDVDLYVRNPQGHVVFFASPSGGLMYLEHDVIPLSTDVVDGHRTAVQGKHERVIITGVIPGEYAVNVMVYNKVSTRPCTVTVKVWSLQGEDSTLLSRTLVLSQGGVERTAFRITLNEEGRITHVSRVQTSFARGPQISSGSPLPIVGGGGHARL